MEIGESLMFAKARLFPPAPMWHRDGIPQSQALRIFRVSWKLSK